MKPNNIVSECPVCSEKETWTGKMEVREGKTYFEMRCEGCASVGFEWSAEWEATDVRGDSIHS